MEKSATPEKAPSTTANSARPGATPQIEWPVWFVKPERLQGKAPLHAGIAPLGNTTATKGTSLKGI
jgi:hypothetical protein